MKKLIIHWILIALCVCPFAEASASEKITGIYTTMTANRQSGDVNGIEVFIVFTKDGFRAVFQDAEGSPSEPVVVPLAVRGREVSFKLPDRRGYSGEFVGTVASGKLIGRFSNGAVGHDGREQISLVRRKSYWQ